LYFQRSCHRDRQCSRLSGRGLGSPVLLRADDAPSLIHSSTPYLSLDGRATCGHDRQVGIVLDVEPARKFPIVHHVDVVAAKPKTDGPALLRMREACWAIALAVRVPPGVAALDRDRGRVVDVLSGVIRTAPVASLSAGSGSGEVLRREITFGSSSSRCC